jgi:hypothetical protein
LPTSLHLAQGGRSADYPGLGRWHLTGVMEQVSKAVAESGLIQAGAILP